MLVQHSWLLFIQLQPLVPSCFTAVTESDLVNLKVSEQWPGLLYLGCKTLPQEPKLQSERTSLFAKERVKVTGLATKPPGFQLTSPTNQLPHERASMQSATAEHLPGSKLNPYSSSCNALFEVSSLTEPTLQADVLSSSSTTPLLFLLTLCSTIWAFFYFATLKKDWPPRTTLFHRKY